MEKILILLIAAFLFAACGTKTVELGNPDFPDNDSSVNDSDSDSQVNSDSDSAVDPDDDTIDDTTMPDNDSVIDPDDDTAVDPDDDSTVIPDEDTVAECTIGERKCDDAFDNVMECNVAHEWISVEDCSAPLKMCVEEPADNFFCDDLVCEPGVKFCKSEDLYTCNTDGQGDTLAKNCTDTQYCNTVSLTCEDMVCDPDQLFCDGNLLKTCNGNGSDSTLSKDCGTGICDEGLENCVFTGALGGDSASPNNRTGKRGNFFNCTKNVKVIEFTQRFNFSGNKDLTWAIYEAEGNSTTYSRIFIKVSTVTGTGDAQYSTGAISVNLVNGKKYLFVTSWAGQISFYDNGNTHPVNVGFGASTTGFNNSSTDLPDSFTNPATFDYVYNQQIKFVE